MKRENTTVLVTLVFMLALAAISLAKLAYDLSHDQTFRQRWDPVRHMAPSSAVDSRTLSAQYGILLVCGTVCYDI